MTGTVGGVLDNFVSLSRNTILARQPGALGHAIEAYGARPLVITGNTQQSYRFPALRLVAFGARFLNNLWKVNKIAAEKLIHLPVSSVGISAQPWCLYVCRPRCGACYRVDVGACTC